MNVNAPRMRNIFARGQRRSYTHPHVYKMLNTNRPGELKFMWKRSYYFNTWYRKIKHGYYGADTLPHIYYFSLCPIYAGYMLIGDFFFHPDIRADWCMPEPFRSWFDTQGYNRCDYY